MRIGRSLTAMSENRKPLDKIRCQQCVHVKVGLLPNRNRAIRVFRTWQSYCDHGERVVFGHPWEIRDASIKLFNSGCEFLDARAHPATVLPPDAPATQDPATAINGAKKGYADIERLNDPSRWRDDAKRVSQREIEMAKIKQILRGAGRDRAD